MTFTDYETQLFIYPIKSLRPIEVQRVELTDHGLRFDRSFALIYDPKSKKPRDSGTAPVVRHLTIKKVFRLALFQPSIDETWSNLTISYTGGSPPSSLTVPLTPSPLASAQKDTYLLSIFGTTAKGLDVGQDAADFFSKHLECDVRLVFIGGLGFRDIPGAAYIPNQHRSLLLALEEGMRPQKIKFADAAPLLLTSTTSEEDCRQRLQEEDRDEDLIIRFRTNIHIDVVNLPAWDEDTWLQLKLRSQSKGTSEITLRCIFQCVRCLSINADMGTGDMVTRERQLYGLLAPDRRVNEKFPRESPSPPLLSASSECVRQTRFRTVRLWRSRWCNPACW